MEDTTKRLAKVLGATGVESMGHDVRFSVESKDGTRLRVNIEGQQQRLMAVLTDANGVTRADLDVAPVQKVTEDPAFPGRVTLHVGAQMIHIDSQPTLAVEIISKG
ncbi:MAG: hypothetical protein AB1730_02055 [Myxococcota bacterium]|jgi:hypothetical protein